MAFLDILLVFVALGAAAGFLFSARLRGSTRWSATVTPLASIMGSGFLVSAPLLGGIVGSKAVFFMAVLLLLAFFVGGALRYNIRHFEPIEHEKGGVQLLALISRCVLGLAYFISVVYYLELLSAFVLHMLGQKDQFDANLVTSFLLIGIAAVGIWKGLGLMEGVERYAVGLNLGMIVALLVALFVYNMSLVVGGEWSLPELDSSVSRQDFRVLLGLLIVVQGFETSRYLGAKHPAGERIETMRLAQLIASGIYLLFILLATVLFQPSMGGDVTAILMMTAPVAMILPLLLSVAAVGSQFSAAVADTAGAGGLVGDLTNQKVGEKGAYALILVVTLALTWVVNVNEIIALASRAFALFYALQCLVAALVGYSKKDFMRLAAFLILAMLCFLVCLFGVPAE